MVCSQVSQPVQLMLETGYSKELRIALGASQSSLWLRPTVQYPGYDANEAGIVLGLGNAP